MLFEFRRQSQDANKTRREPWAWFSSRWTRLRRLRRSRHSRAERLEDRTLLAVFDVTTTADVISAVDGVLSLREAMIAAETNVGSDTINLPAGTYFLTIPSGTENATTGLVGTVGDLDLTNTNGGQVVTIVGAGSSSTIIDANDISRHFHVSQASGSTVTLVIQGVTLRNGKETGGAADNGGSILTSGNVRVTDSRLTGNVASGSGGAIQITNAGGGNVVITGSTLDGNLAGAFGGAIRTELGTALTIQNSTLSGNSVVGGAAVGDGGAISIRTSSLGNIALTSVTITSNSASRRGGGISYDSTSLAGGTQAIKNTIISGNTATSSNPDVDGTFVAANQEFNIIGIIGTAVGFTNGVQGNQVGTAGSPLNPSLGPLADNGGPTLTHAILVGSIAADQGKSFGLTTDQIGETRPTDIPSAANGTGDAADVGAFEIPILTAATPGGGNCLELRLNTVNNHIELISVDLGNVLVASKPAGSLAAVVVNGTAGQDDCLIVNFANSLPTTFAIAFNGGAGGNDELRFINNVHTTDNYNYSNAADGAVSFDGRLVDFTGVERLNNRGTATTQNFNFTASNDTVALQDIGVVSGNQSNRLNSVSSTFPQTEFVSPAAAAFVFLNLGDGNDTAQLTGAVASYPGSLNIVGGNGTDLASFNQSLTIGGVLTVTTETITVGAAVTSTSVVATAVDFTATTVNLNDNITATSSTVEIDATTLTDGNAAATNITAASAVLRVTGGVGTLADPLETSVTTIAGTAGGTGFHISDASTTTIGTVNGTMGIAVTMGGVSVVVTGPLTVNQAVTESGGGNITLTSTDDVAAPEPDTLTIDANVSATGGNGNISLNGENVTVGTGATTPTVSTLGTGTLDVTAGSSTTLSAGSTLLTAGATLTITTDDIAIDVGGTPASVNAGAGIVTIRNNSNDRLIDLGSNTANRLSLTDAELDRVTAGILRIGRSDANDPGIVLISSTITLVPTTLHILSGDIIQQSVGANVVVSNLALTTSSTVSLGNVGNVVDNVAISSGQNVTFRNSQVTGLSVGTVDGLIGVSATGSVSLRESLGSLTITNTAAANDVSAGTTIDLTVDADNALLTFAAGSNSQSIGGAHVYTADEIDIQAGAAITATGLIVTLQPNEAGELINIGSMGMAANDVLELSDAELDRVTATTIRVGRNDASAAGAVTISMTTTVTTATNLHVRTGSTVMQTAALTAANFAVSAGGGVTLNAMTNDVDTFAVATSAGDVSFIDIDGFSVGAVDSVNGVAAAAGNLSLASIMGNLIVTNTPAANDVSASGTISLQVMGDDNTLTIASGANSASTGGDHSYVADKMALAGTITGTGRIVTLTSNESGELVNLGSLTDVAADTLELSSAELSNIAASVLRIGNANTSVITVSQNVAAVATTLSLTTGSSIGGASGITASNLALNAVGAINLSAGSSDVDVLAASVTGANLSFAFNDSDGLTIGTADGIVGLTTNNANASITAGGLLTIDDDIALGSGNAILDTAGATQNAGDTIIAAGLCLAGTGTFSLTEANDVDTLAASATGNISYSDIDALTVGTINAKVGITSGNGNVTITTGMALTIGSGAGQDINAGTGIVSLTVTLGGAAEAAGSIITASQLRLSGPGAGAFDLDENNAVGLIAASINGQLDFVTTTALNVSTSGAIVGVNTNGNNATIRSSGDMSLSQPITAATARVLLTSTAGAIVDTNAGSNNITASALGLTAANGIGSGNSIETAVSTLAATNSTTGNIEVTNVVGSLLTITTVGTIVGITNSAPAGNVTVTNGSPLTVAANVIAVGDIFLKALESVIPGAGDDLTVNAGVSIISTGGNVTLEAGDNVILTAGSIVTAAGSVSIKSDCGNNDVAGTTITINGTINSGTGATANGDTDSDSIIVGSLGTGGLTLNAESGDDTYTINYPAGSTFSSAITVGDSSGSDTLNVNGSVNAEAIFIRTTLASDTVSRGATNTETVTYNSSIEFLNVAGGSGNDTFDVQPSQLVPIFIDGQPPVFGDAGVPPGDTLLFDPGANTFDIINKSTIVTTNTGGGPAYKNVTFTSIETFGLAPLGTVTRRFDMDEPLKNSGGIPFTQAGYTSVRPDTLFTDGLGYGWNSPLTGTDSGAGVTMGTQFALQRDGHTASFLRTFTVNVGAANNGFYYVTVLLGSYGVARTGQFVRNLDAGTLLASNVVTAANEFTHRSFYINITDGTLDLEFGSTTQNNSRFSVAAIELRPANTQTISGVGGTFLSDGVTIDTFTSSGAVPNSVLTLSTNLGTIVNVDIDPTIAGIQVLADAGGSASVMVRRPFGVGTATVLIEDVTGAAFGCILPLYTGATSRRFDFNHGDSPTQAPVLSALNPDGYIGVLSSDAYSAAAGYGWLTTPVSRTNRPITVNGALNDLRRDGHQGSSPQIFRVDLANGTYTGILTIGSAHNGLDDVQVSANGVVIASNINLPTETWTQITFTATVVNGTIQFEFSDPGPNKLWVINGLEIRATASVVPITFAGASGAVAANGTTTTAITTDPTGLAVGSTVTVASSLGSITTVDTEPGILGTQVLVGAGGVVSFDIQSPTAGGTPTISVTAVDGSAIGSISSAAFLNFSLPTVRRLDFNSGNIDTQVGFVGVLATQLFSPLIGFGYLTNLPQSLNLSQPIPVTSTALYRDNHFGTASSPRTFQVQVKSGVNYDVRAYVGTQQSDLNNVEIRIEGVSVVAAPTTAFNFTTATLLNVVDTNADGLLSIEFVDAGGATNLWAINGLDIAEVGLLPASAPLRAASISEQLPSSESNDPAKKLTQSQLDSAIQAALEFWKSAGLTASQLDALRNVNVTIEELAAENALGLAGSSVIKIDDDGASLGWHTDFTSPVTSSQYDLATVVAHEMGHILGLGDLDPNLSPSELMTGELQPGERHIAMTDSFFRLLAETTEANWLGK